VVSADPPPPDFKFETLSTFSKKSRIPEATMKDKRQRGRTGTQ